MGQGVYVSWEGAGLWRLRSLFGKQVERRLWYPVVRVPTVVRDTPSTIVGSLFICGCGHEGLAKGHTDGRS